MILVIIGILFVLTILTWCIADEETGVGFLALTLLTVSVAAFLTTQVKSLNVIDDKIAMYESQNAKIEEQIAGVVERYMEYESGVFTEVSSDSAITLVALYPELKSDALVESQIELYTENNRKITELMEKKINGSVTRWWLYFGGE